MENIINDVKKFPKLMLGFMIMGGAIWLMSEVELGMPPWDCLTQGLTNYLPFSFGVLSQISGLLILLVAILLKVYPGVGTILNIVFIGVFYDMFDILFNVEVQSLAIRLLIVVFASFLMAVGFVLYFLQGLGQGPRDSVILGVYKIYNVKYGFIKFGIEAVVLIIGVLLGGTAGVGTAMALFFISFFVQEIFNRFKIDPKEIKQKSLQDYKHA